VHYWADLQSVHGLRCYGNTRNAWQSPVVICTHYARTMHARTSDKIDAPAPCATLSATRLFHFIHTVGCCNVTCLYSLYAQLLISTERKLLQKISSLATAWRMRDPPMRLAIAADSVAANRPITTNGGQTLTDCRKL